MEKKIGHPRVSPRFEWLFVLFTFMQTAGVFVDGWAHGHINQLDTFFTPWHALFYGGFIFSSGLLFIELLKNHRNGYPWRRGLPRGYFFALGGGGVFCFGGVGVFIFFSGLLFIELLKNHRNGYPWRRALPREYFFALGGVVIFGLGGLGDLVWHTLFGIEAGVDALLSPTHMALAFGGAVMASAPLHAIWYRDTNVHRILKLPVIISFALFFMVFTFMMQFL